MLTRLRDIIARDERGAAAMEFALLLAPLMLILLGAIDFGRFAFAAITISNAARTGAANCQYSSCAGISDGDIRQVVHDEAQPHLDIPMTSTNIPISRPTADPGCTASRPCLRVGVVYAFATLVPWPGMPASFNIVRQAQIVTAIQ